MLLVGGFDRRLLTVLGFTANTSGVLGVSLALDDAFRLADGSHVVQIRLGNRIAYLLFERSRRLPRPSRGGLLRLG